MEISQAKQALESLLSVKKNEIAAIQTALDILNEKYAPDFTALATAQEEANRLAAEKNTAISDKVKAEADRDQAIADKEAETKRADDAEAALGPKDQPADTENTPQ